MSLTGFSVLMSLYIKESKEHFNECMTSLWCNQSLKPNEIVLVKDGPLTADLEYALNKWQSLLGEALVIIPIEENVGLGKALNIGLSHCSYDWVFRMDTDDICHPQRFEKQIEYIINHPSTDILSGQIAEFENSIENITGIRSVPLTHDNIIKYSKFRSPFNHVAIAFKKSIIHSVGGYKHHLYMEDYNLWLRLLSSGYKGANLEDTLVLVRAGESMVARRRGNVYLKSEWQLYKLKKFLDYQSPPIALLTFVVRSTPRLLPISLLNKVYSKLRQHGPS